MANIRQHLRLFPVLVQVSDIEGSKGLNDKLCESIYELMKTEPNTKPENWACEVYTTIMSGKMLLDTPPFDALVDIITAEVGKYAHKLKLDIEHYPPRINECWLNVYANGNSQDVHVHRNSVISGIYYPKAPEGCAEVLFHSPWADQMLEPPLTGPDPINATCFNVKPVSGRMVLFRSWLRHSVKLNPTDDERISIAFNLTM